MLRSLERSFAGSIHTSHFARRCYAGAAGIYAQRPRAVAFPASEADVAAAVDFCRSSGVPLTARGAGSGMAGNNVGRGLVLDFTRHLNRIRGFDPADGSVTVEPGVTYDALNDFLRPHGRFLPPNPSSGAFCTLGGMVANNASGMRSVKYGSTAPWLVGARGFWGTGEPFDLRRLSAGDGIRAGGVAACGQPRALPGADGERHEPDPERVAGRLNVLFRDGLPLPPAWLGGVLKNSAGLRVWSAWTGDRVDALDLLASSEGTLAVMTELTFRTAPLPGDRSLLLAAFRSLDDMARAVDALRPLAPSGIEFLDRTFLGPLRGGDARARAAVPREADAVLFVEMEGHDSADAARARGDALEALAGHAVPGATLARGPMEAEALWRLRRGASPWLARRHPRRVPMQFVEDCAVPPSRFARLLRELRRLFAEEDVPVVLFGHAGEAHVHANPLLDPDDPLLAARIDRVAERVCGLVDELEGTLTGEHGDGLARAAFAERRFGAAASFFAAVRGVCDPAGVLNPGKILPAPGWSTGRDLRHPWERRLLRARASRRSSGPPQQASDVRGAAGAEDLDRALLHGRATIPRTEARKHPTIQWSERAPRLS